MTDHLYPARLGMLRTGTPTSVGVVGHVHPCGTPKIGTHEYSMRGPIVPCIDLRDVTARAHAAMPYTRVGCHSEVPGLPAYPDVALEGLPWDASIYVDGDRERGQLTDEAYAHFCTLARMRMMDPSVSVSEARAALDWAHAASGGEA